MSTTPELLRAARGLREALQRWEPTRLDSNPESMLIETTVVLWWLRALDELLTETSADYSSELAVQAQMHDLLAGLRHARNRLGHRFARAIDVSHKGRAYPRVYPMVYFELFWVDAVQLDQFGGRSARTPRQLDGEAAYTRAVAGQLVRVTVPAAVRWMLDRPELEAP